MTDKNRKNAKAKNIPYAESPETAAPKPTREQIAERAYHLFETRGRTSGAELEDWLQAEKDLRAASGGVVSALLPR